MRPKKSLVNGNLNATTKSQQASAISNNEVSPQQANIRMVQNALVIWLDSNIDDNSADCRNTVTKLRRVMNTINTFTGGNQCIEFLHNLQNDKACMIISGSLGQHIVPRVHNMSQVDSIFIFCSNKSHHEQWTKNWPKIKGVFTEISPICEALKQAAQQCEQNAISISFMGTSGDLSKKNLDKLDPSFMYAQILKEILLSIEFEQIHIQEFIDHCRAAFAENESELKKIDKVKNQYRDKTPIWWYTYECFLYPMLNRALRFMDVDIIIKMGFFIGDLHRHIQQLHLEQFGDHHTADKLTVYRGQGMSETDFDQMTKTKGGLMSFNNFLSTSKDRNVSLLFAESNQSNPDLVGILFIMAIDPAILTTPFASIVDVSYYEDAENEVLFSMNTVFRIGEIKPMGENHHLFQVDLTLTSDNDKDLRVLTDRIREETFPKETGWNRLGLLLNKIGQSAKSQQIYQTLMDQTSHNSDQGNIYERLGTAKYRQGEYKKALALYEKSLQIRQQTPPANDAALGYSYNHIGLVYYSMGEYLKALSSHEKALEIWQQSLPSNHPDLAASYNNISLVYDSMGEYPKALSSHEKALEIKQQLLPSNHPDLATSHNNIGNVYRSMGEYPKALLSHEKALEIRRQSLLSSHPDLTASYNNIGLVYDSMGEYPKALSSHEKALEILQRLIPSNHPDFALPYYNIGNVYYSMGEYPKALSSHEKALEIRQQSLPSNHPVFAGSYNCIGIVYDSMGEYPKALLSHEKALEIRQQSLPSNHPDLAASYNNMGEVHLHMNEYPEALSFFEKTLNIQQKTLPPYHSDLTYPYKNMGLVYENMSEYSKACAFYERAIDIGQKSLPSDHPELQKCRKYLHRVKEKL